MRFLKITKEYFIDIHHKCGSENCPGISNPDPTQTDESVFIAL